MALSGSSNYSVTALQIIDAALRVLGWLRSGVSVSSDTNLQTDALQALNLMVKTFQSMGLEAWVRKQTSFDLLTSTTSYTITTDLSSAFSDVPERIIQAWRQDSSGNDTEMFQLSMSEYRRLTDKDSTGVPTNYAYDFQNSTGELYVWPIVTSSTTYDMFVVYHKPFDDLDATTNTFEFPQRWYEPLKWNLALRLAPEIGRNPDQTTMFLAQKTLQDAIDGGYDEASIKFKPSGRRRMNRVR